MAPRKPASGRRDFTSLEEATILEAPAWRTWRPIGSSLSNSAEHQRDTEDCEKHMCCLRSDDFNKGATSRTSPSPIRHAEFRFSPTDNTMRVGGGDAGTSWRRLQGGKRRPKATSLPAPTQVGQDFRPKAAHPATPHSASTQSH